MNDYIRAVEKWGMDSQVTHTMEECGELITALNKWYFRGGSVMDALEEMADVEIMIDLVRENVINSGLVSAQEALKMADKKYEKFMRKLEEKK